MNYNGQCCNDTNIQHFRMDDSSELKYTLVELIDPIVPHVVNHVTTNYGNIVLGGGLFVDTSCTLQVAVDFYYN